MGMWGAVAMLLLLLLGIALFARAYFGGMRFGERLERRRAADADTSGAADAEPASRVQDLQDLHE